MPSRQILTHHQPPCPWTFLHHVRDPVVTSDATGSEGDYELQNLATTICQKHIESGRGNIFPVSALLPCPPYAGKSIFTNVGIGLPAHNEQVLPPLWTWMGSPLWCFISIHLFQVCLGSNSFWICLLCFEFILWYLYRLRSCWIFNIFGLVFLLDNHFNQQDQQVWKLIQFFLT